MDSVCAKKIAFIRVGVQNKQTIMIARNYYIMKIPEYKANVLGDHCIQDQGTGFTAQGAIEDKLVKPCSTSCELRNQSSIQNISNI